MSHDDPRKILVVDDEPGIRELLSEILRDEGHHVAVAENAERAWARLLEFNPDLVLLDIWMPDTDGVTLLKQWRNGGDFDTPVIVMSGHATIDTAVEAMKHGALEVLEKPTPMRRLLEATNRALARTSARPRAAPAVSGAHFGRSPPMRKLKEELAAASTSKSPALIISRPDDGGLFYAQFLCPPGKTPLIIERAAKLTAPLQPMLREGGASMLLVRMANLLNPAQQSGLLSLLREAMRLEVRVVVESTTPLPEEPPYNESLAKLLSRNVVRVPPFSECRSDIPEMVALIAQRFAAGSPASAASLSTDAINLLVNRSYKNGFMELLAIVRGALLTASTEQASVEVTRAVVSHFGEEEGGVSEGVFNRPLREAREVFEREYLRRLLTQTENNIPRAASASGLERTSLYRKMRQLGLDANISPS